MADYEKSRKFGDLWTATGADPNNPAVKAYPVDAEEVSPLFARVEPILSPSLLKSRFLKGIDLGDYTEEELKDYINLALNEGEVLTGLRFTKTQIRQRIAYDKNIHGKEYVYFRLHDGPVLSVERVAIEGTTGEELFVFPPAWIEVGLLRRRIVSILPIIATFGITGESLSGNSPTNVGLVLLNMIQYYAWLPGYFTITYTVGTCREEGQLPIIINQLVGTIAAINVLDSLQAQNIYTYKSISQEGISQSSSNPGPKIYEARINFLAQKRDELVRKIKAEFAEQVFVTNI